MFKEEWKKLSLGPFSTSFCTPFWPPSDKVENVSKPTLRFDFLLISSPHHHLVVVDMYSML